MTPLALPARCFDESAWPRWIERTLLTSWHWLGESPTEPGTVTPLSLLPELRELPLLAVREHSGLLSLLSNVCTHRGNRLVQTPGPAKVLRCGYHGRRFHPAGRCLASPGFEGVAGFPFEADHLPKADFIELGPMLLARALPPQDDGLGAELHALFAGLPLHDAVHDPSGDRAFEIAAHWALWVENYLEGLHIPFVHPALARSLSLGAYRTRTCAWGSVQVGVAAPGEPALSLAPTHPDQRPDEAIAGLYIWVFPGICLNIYPWGVSLNAVQPLGPRRTRIVYRRYVWDPGALGRGAGGDLDTVEGEDDAVVEQVQRGIGSPFFLAARPSAQAEAGVVHFHAMLARALDEELV